MEGMMAVESNLEDFEASRRFLNDLLASLAVVGWGSLRRDSGSMSWGTCRLGK